MKWDLSIGVGALIVGATPTIGIPLAFVATMGSSAGMAVFDNFLRKQFLEWGVYFVFVHNFNTVLGIFTIIFCCFRSFYLFLLWYESEISR